MIKTITIKTITIVVIIFAFLYIGYIVFEHYYYNYLRKKIKKIIHVNGIRGKSTTTRLIDAGLRNCNKKVMSKTTGTIPMIIDVNNQEIKLKRLGPANIREQLRILRKAVKSGCDYLVIECMAVNPELQYICEHKMLHSDISVITNVRMDHLDVMGDNLKDISRSLSNTIPDNGILILGSEIGDNEEIFNVIKEENNKYHSEIFVSDKKNDKSFLDDELFNDNILTALKVCEVLGLDKEDFIKGMKQYKKDPGALEIIKRNDKTFINGFSINDPDSIMLVYDLLINKYNIDKNKLTILLNERGDRIFRTKQHIEMFKKIECEKVIISGDNVGYISKELGKIGIENKIIKRIDELDNYEIIFGIGNIKGFGFEVIDYYKKEKDR